jgi:Anti-sigma-K factor rskA
MSETGPQNQPDEATVDLLIKQVTEGLSPAEERALDVLDSEIASGYARDLERAAAAVTLAGTPVAEPLPSELRERIEAEARAFFASASGARAAAIERKPAAQTVARGTPARSTAGWWAAAACLVLAVAGWLRSPPSLVAPPAATLADERAALLAQPDSLKVNFGATKEPAAAKMTGDVVWDPATQRGYARFVGLAPNDPKLNQYQLWIFDAARDQRYPVDGGVFNVPADGSELIVPIRTALPVHVAKAFAVTLEKPGGVVVSDRDHVVALGQAG